MYSAFYKGFQKGRVPSDRANQRSEQTTKGGFMTGKQSVMKLPSKIWQSIMGNDQGFISFAEKGRASEKRAGCRTLHKWRSQSTVIM